MSDGVFEQGMAIRREVLGAEHVARAQANSTPFDTENNKSLWEGRIKIPKR